jgi:hypothetical protein
MHWMAGTDATSPQILEDYYHRYHHHIILCYHFVVLQLKRIVVEIRH